MTNPVDEIKNKLDVVEVIGNYVKLVKAGRNYKALCPFHNEKTPSFMVSPERQIWHCFGCGKGGSIFDFIMELEGMEFGDALKLLAQRAGVELKKTDPKLTLQLKTEKSRLYEIYSLASQFFAKQLQASQAGKRMGDYLLSRGLKPGTIKEWQVGYAPKTWDALSGYLKKCGYSQEEILKTGLIVKSAQDNKCYDRFRDRIMFPIANLSGAIVGFSGRENPKHPDPRMGKYINTPNTLIYDKSRILYGLDKAKLGIRQKDQCILAEGQTDVLMAHQNGFDNVVAGSGTALTEHQLRIIKRYSENLVMAYDMDKAGETAAKRGLDLALARGFNAKVITLPANQDPADCLKKNPKIFEEAVNQAQNLVEFYLHSAFSKSDPETVEGKGEITNTLLPVVAKIANKVEQAHWLQQIAWRLKTSETALNEEMKRVAARPFSFQKPEPLADKAKVSGTQLPSLESYTLGLVLVYPQALAKCRKEAYSLFTNPELQEIFKYLRRKKTGKIDFKKLKKGLPLRLAGQLDYIIFQAEAKKGLVDDFKPENEIEFCLNQLKKQQRQNKLNALSLAIRQAEEKKDKNVLCKLTNEFNKLLKQA